MIVFSAMRELSSEEYWKVFMTDPGTGRIQEIPTPARIDCTYPLWSPKHDLIAFTGNERATQRKSAIYIHNASRNTTYQITSYQQSLSAIGWKSDNTHVIAHTVNEKEEQLLLLVDVVMHTSSVLDVITGYWGFALTPSAEKLAYVPQGNVSHIYIKDVGAISTNSLFDEPFTAPRDLQWSPNEQYISFTTSDTSDEDTILNVVEVATGSKRHVSGIPYDFHYAWSPNSAYLAYIGTKDLDYALYVLNVQTGISSYLVTLNRGDPTGVMKPSNPGWSSDSSRVAIGSFEDDRFALFIADIHASTTHITRVNTPPFSLFYDLHWY